MLQDYLLIGYTGNKLITEWRLDAPIRDDILMASTAYHVVVVHPVSADLGIKIAAHAIAVKSMGEIKFGEASLCCVCLRANLLGCMANVEDTSVFICVICYRTIETTNVITVKSGDNVKNPRRICTYGYDNCYMVISEGVNLRGYIKKIYPVINPSEVVKITDPGGLRGAVVCVLCQCLPVEAPNLVCEPCRLANLHGWSQRHWFRTYVMSEYLPADIVGIIARYM